MTEGGGNNINLGTDILNQTDEFIVNCKTRLSYVQGIFKRIFTEEIGHIYEDCRKIRRAYDKNGSCSYYVELKHSDQYRTMNKKELKEMVEIFHIAPAGLQFIGYGAMDDYVPIVKYKVLRCKCKQDFSETETQFSKEVDPYDLYLSMRKRPKMK